MLTREELQKVRTTLVLARKIAVTAAQYDEALGIIDLALSVGSSLYNLRRIAWELERTAMGDSYYGNALRVAKDVPGLTPTDRSLLDRYATGATIGTDHIALQDLALRLYTLNDEALQSCCHY